MTRGDERSESGELAGSAWTQAALGEMNRGVREYPGSQADNPRILEYFRSTTYVAEHDEVPWCSAFVNWCMKEAGQQGTGSAAARSWLGWGQELASPVPGCVAVLWRGSPDSNQGHVGFYLGPSPDWSAHVNLLGGNQGNQVSVKAYPRGRVLSYRAPL
ncbi:MAG: TIGR02594 family protein [Desulfarculaceae bacterium]|nr:TIGR02594 family protein [Desulfarculaceae bacterium]